MIQQGGELALPDYEFRWWNSKTQKLESVVIEGKSFQAKHTLKSFVKAYFAWIVALISLALIGMAVFFAVKRFYRNRPTPAWLAMHRLLKAKRWGEARALLYKQLRVNTSELEMHKADPSDSWRKRSTRLQNGEQSSNLIKSMWRTIQTKKKQFKFAIPKALPQLDKLNRNSDISED